MNPVAKQSSNRALPLAGAASLPYQTWLCFPTLFTFGSFTHKVQRLAPGVSVGTPSMLLTQLKTITYVLSRGWFPGCTNLQ
jgi:hypothetical protein